MMTGYSPRPNCDLVVSAATLRRRKCPISDTCASTALLPLLASFRKINRTNAGRTGFWSGPLGFDVVTHNDVRTISLHDILLFVGLAPTTLRRSAPSL